MVSFRLHVNLNHLFQSVTSFFGGVGISTEPSLTHQYRSIVREIDMIALRVMGTILMLATLTLTIILIPRAALVVERLVTSISTTTHSVFQMIREPRMSSAMFHLALYGLLMLMS